MNTSQQKHYDQIKAIVESKRGYLLSSIYTGCDDKVTVRCSNDHQWDITPRAIKQNKWCPQCLNRKTNMTKEDHYNEIRTIVESKGGKVISTSYIDSKTKMKFRCQNNHDWETTSRVIKVGKWCPLCRSVNKHYADIVSNEKKNKLKYDKISDFIIDKGGKLLSTTYKSYDSKLKIKCKYNHEFERPWEDLKNNRWCFKCDEIESQEKHYEIINNIINQRGGTLLSDSYKDNSTKVEVKCINGHIYYIRPCDVKENKGCPDCNISIGERLIKQYLESNNIRYEREYRINNIPNRRFDFYCEKDSCKFLIEFDGEQHFNQVEFFDKSGYTLEERHIIDRVKTGYGQMEGYKIIRLDYKLSRSNFSNLEKHLDQAFELKYTLYLSDPELYQDWLYTPVTKEDVELVKNEYSEEVKSSFTSNVLIFDLNELTI